MGDPRCRDEANGHADTLREAIGFLDQALTYEPDNEQLLEERRLAIDYVTGAGAFAQEEWEIAIARWGPIYAIRRDYQRGALEAALKEACSKSFEPDEELCPPP